MLSLLDIPYDIQTNITEMAPNLYQLRSKTKEYVIYTVDMTIGRCEYFAGKDGSSCWHQYSLWSKRFPSSFHFLPKFDTFQRKGFAEIAVGKNLESFFYEPLNFFKKLKDMRRKLVQQIQSEFKEIVKWKTKPMN